nr:MAG TPA: hypothetical protein [Caudoviricetes sp.]
MGPIVTIDGRTYSFTRRKNDNRRQHHHPSRRNRLGSYRYN